ncbi:cupin domain-containing protein [Mycolicibacterium flavescens]|uniref:Cupin n=1 Tax=Mycolicibacterium flavescens TaxID=1776 RepID=A0A1E3RQ62_MYCFV|nr:cupin domain-containing protein [Mycolicibacterium flavescens]MCV7278074.1 cupin domain-containing protein [Mycolicibacterium flavescens]ODQ91552.1 cupin [Mycolicibacterium flavescens]
MKRVILAVSGAAIVAGLGPAAAHATPAEGDIERTDIAKGTTDAPIAIVAVGHPTTLHVQNLVLGPASSSGWHTHPGPEYSVVNEGAVHLQTANACAPAIFGAGQAIFIPAGVPHVVANKGVEHAEATVTYTVPADRAVRDDAAAACP